MSERKHVTTIALSDEVFDDINSIGEGKSFTAKIVNIVERVKREEGELVRYETEEQWENITPRIINKNAYREFVDSAVGKGPTSNGLMWSIVTSQQKITKKLILEDLKPRLMNMGYIVQVINDVEHAVFDVWVAKRENRCKECERIKKDLEKIIRSML
jgi:hypothetical protein